MGRILVIAVLIAALSGAGAAPARASDAEFFSMLGGAALGGFVGNQFGRGSGRVAATGLGAVTGAVVGSHFGRSIDRANRGYYYGGYGGGYYGGYGPDYYSAYHYYPQYVAPPAPPQPRIIYVQPEVVEYRMRGPAYVEGGYVGAGSMPLPSSYCREFTQQVRIGGQIKETYGTACLQPDGSWRIER